ncbi:MAG: TAXI family TRAP transporter solute-binding subunit [Deltaproteobacteria bacterium]|nr:TAXI family TRAP transporter solute-binding subunit [Deltaproteobacteria bacterium]
MKKVKLVLVTIGFLVFSISGLFVSPDALAEKKDPYIIEIYSAPMGMSGYVLSFALSDFINKNSEKLEATCIETKSSIEDMITLIKHPEKKANWIGFVNPIIRYQAQHGITPFKDPYSDIRALSPVGQACAAFATLDPKIKTMNDMVGKKVMIFHSNTNVGQVHEFILKGEGLFDKMKIVRGNMADATRALIDRIIDVGWISSNPMIKNPDGTWDWTAVPASSELFETEESFIISIPEEFISRAAERTGYPLYPITNAPKTCGKSTFDKPWTGPLFSSSWYVHKDMPDEVVTEIMRVLWENADKFASYHAAGKGINQSNLSEIMEKQEFIHPAVIKFHKDHGVEKVGID